MRGAAHLPAPGSVSARLPRVSTVTAAVLGFFLSISPSSLPHGMVLQGALSAAFVLMCIQVVAMVRPRRARWHGRERAVGVALVGLLAGGVLVGGDRVLDAARAEAGMPLLGWWYWTGVVTIVVSAALVRHAGECAWRGRTVSRAVWRPLVTATVCTGLVLAGGPVHGAPRGHEPDRVLLEDSPVGAVRSYAEIRPGEAITERAERAAEELVREGGLTRSRVVVAVPTGSGWIDPHFVAGVEKRFGADVATVGLQYDTAPSWYSYLLRRERAVDGARAVFDAVAARLRRLPAGRRPDLHVHGQSLGATAGQEIFRGPGREPARGLVCSVLWVGTPGGTRVGLPHEGTVSNPDDPIVHAPWHDLGLPGSRPSGLPFVSVVHDVADVVGSTDVAVGTGHRYGQEQATRLATC